MPDNRTQRTGLPPAERRARSELAQLVSQQPLLRATLAWRQRVCGKPNCRCARGHKHASLYLVLQQQGQYRQLFVPKDWEAKVIQWVDNARRAQQLMDELSRTYWDKVQQRRD